MKTRQAHKIIIALDVNTGKQALDLADKLDMARIFKIGLELFTAEGPSLFREMKKRKKRIFLDLKLHDIPNTVAGAVSAGTEHGIHMMTLHASGGLEMMRRAGEAAASAAQKTGHPRPLLLGVTVLTSLRSQELNEIGMIEDTEAQVLRLAQLAKLAGMDGVVCSPWEIDLIKGKYGKDFLVVSPGIRPAWAAAQDQKRIMTPAQAVQKGADYIVIGRPISKAPSPSQALEAIVKELEES
ncbi:MAG: orotidine-5'-phosphate decarboxylase [Candidatus Aminicenantes bacterium]|nr:orotidine-5'-phosphate decarboxylase [Candidatus Aminicenantes bacterium]